MHIYVINLDRRPDRVAHLASEAARVGVSFQRVPAVDGNHSAVKERALSIKPGIFGEQIGPYVLACFESHRKAWRIFLDTDEPHCIVLEDDVIFADGFGRLLEVDWLPADADLVRLETYLPAPAKFDLQSEATVDGRGVHRLRSTFLGAGAYIISRSAAERLLELTENISDAIDVMLFHEKSPLFSKLTIYQLIPAAVIQGVWLAGHSSEGWAQSSLNPERSDFAARRSTQRNFKLIHLRRKLLGPLWRVRGWFYGILHTRVPFG